jgi:Tol biopolymer transport system component
VTFDSFATNLVDDDTNGVFDVFVHDRMTGTTTRVSVNSAGAQGDRMSFAPSLSADGRFVAFASLATNLVDDDTNGTSDVFVHDRITDTTSRVSRCGTTLCLQGFPAEGDDHSLAPSLSADGRFVAFDSLATNLADEDTNGSYDVFVHDRMTGTTSRVSRCGTTKVFCLQGFPANGDSGGAALSADGRFVAFASLATNLVDDDTNDDSDVFVHDRITGTTSRVSRCGTTKVFCLQGFPANGDSRSPALPP